MTKIYLGDSVYCAFDGHGILLTTENGYPDDPRNNIYLEPETWFALEAFVKNLRSRNPIQVAGKNTTTDGQ